MMDFVYAIQCMPEDERNILLDMYKKSPATNICGESHESVNRAEVEKAKTLVGLGLLTCRDSSTYTEKYWLGLTPLGAQVAAYYMIRWDGED